MLWALDWRTGADDTGPSPVKTKRPSSAPMMAATTSVTTRDGSLEEIGVEIRPLFPREAARVSGTNAVVGVVVPLPRRGLVGEGGQERLVVGVDAVAQQVVGRLVELRRERGRPGESPQFDVGDVVGQATAVGEPGVVTAEHAE